MARVRPDDGPEETTGPSEVERAIERSARDSYSRLVAFLAARSRDVAAAEDALGDAFQAALHHWPATGVPDKPEAWLLTTARRRLIDGARHRGVEGDAARALLPLADEAERLATGEPTFPDERLALLFLCAHPAIDAAVRTPLMLQTVLGLPAARIASAFLVQPAAMGQRLSRAKTKIRDARIPFVLPERRDLPPRLGAVLEAIYGAYGSGWQDLTGAESATARRGLAGEALELGQLLVGLLPEEPEAAGLLALMLHCEARRPARRSADAAYVPLSEQDVSLWSRSMIVDADRLLHAAELMGRVGPFQLEAAIQSAHARRASPGGVVDWESVALLYEGLVRLAPTVGALVGRAAAVSEARGAAVGLAFLDDIRGGDDIRGDAVADYQPYWAARAHLLQRLGHADEARAAYARAIGLSEDPAVRAFLLARSALS
jgi:RNA polymerase sigma-70 factor (ECF subfamily)